MPRSPAKIETREREGKVLELRKAGATFAQIAQVLGFHDQSGAKKAYDRAMQNTIQQPADEIRKLEIERLDALWKANYPNAMKGRGFAIEKAIMIMDRRAKLLGLDAPTRIQATITDEMTAEIERLAAELDVATDPDAAAVAH